MKAKYLLFMGAFLCISGWGPFTFLPINKEPIGSREWFNKETRAINSQADNINSTVLKTGLTAYARAHSVGLGAKNLLTIIDYSKPSTERRLWVVDLRNGKVLFNTWVSHGRNSGNVSATSFSNQPGSLKSSIGVFLTTREAYVGSNGYSLRMRGLENGINDNAYRRDIVFHGAWYASGNVARKYGILGRSWGCPAVSEEAARPLINTIKDNTLVVAYYPDRNWLRRSAFVAG